MVRGFFPPRVVLLTVGFAAVFASIGPTWQLSTEAKAQAIIFYDNMYCLAYGDDKCTRPPCPPGKVFYCVGGLSPTNCAGPALTSCGELNPTGTCGEAWSCVLEEPVIIDDQGNILPCGDKQDQCLEIFGPPVEPED